jgi:hypothetical protein
MYDMLACIDAGNDVKHHRNDRNEHPFQLYGWPTSYALV